MTSAVLASGGTTIKSYGYTYDNGANRQTETIDGTTNTFTNNSINQLTNISGTGQTLQYDANGNLIADSFRTMTWDGVNRLTKIVGNQTSEFTYDGLGRCTKIVEKTISKNPQIISTKNFIWCGAERCVETETIGSTTTMRRYFAQGMLEGPTSGGGSKYFYTRDHLGSIREMTDNAGTVVARYDYDPWGRQTALVTTKDASFGYAGYYKHAPSGLWLTWYRQYDPNFGKWLSRDPVGEKGGLNLYGYVDNTPIAFLDLLGLARCCIDKPLQVTLLSQRNDSNFLGISFKVTASFRPIDPTCPDCDPNCCQVRQEVIGKFRYQGVPVPHTTPAGKPLSGGKYNYDWFGLGLISPSNGVSTNSFYQQNPAGGVDFEGTDTPGLPGNPSFGGLGPGDSIWLGFKAYVWDDCQKRKVGNQLRYGFSGNSGGGLKTWGF